MDLFAILMGGEITGEQIWWVVKLFYLLGLVMYMIFAVVLVRQVGLMSKTLNGSIELPIKWLARLHLFVTVGVVVLALVVL